MGTQINQEIEAFQERQAYDRLWIIAFIVSAISVVPVLIFKEKAPWVILFPILIGGITIAFFEIRDAIRRAAKDASVGFVVDSKTDDLLPPEPMPFHSNFWLQLKKVRKNNPTQLDLFEFMVEDREDRRKVQIVPSPKGDIYVLSAERFQEILLDRTMEHMDKATEHALAVAFKRHGGQLQNEARELLRKQFRETIKDDVRGNLVKLLCNKGAEIISELVKDVEKKPEKKLTIKEMNELTLEA